MIPNFLLSLARRLLTSTGLLVQWEDAWLATRKSGFDSPVVHYEHHANSTA